jgi:hypothetical protein
MSSGAQPGFWSWLLLAIVSLGVSDPQHPYLEDRNNNVFLICVKNKCSKGSKHEQSVHKLVSLSTLEGTPSTSPLAEPTAGLCSHKGTSLAFWQSHPPCPWFCFLFFLCPVTNCVPEILLSILTLQGEYSHKTLLQHIIVVALFYNYLLLLTSYCGLFINQVGMRAGLTQGQMPAIPSSDKVHHFL